MTVSLTSNTHELVAWFQMEFPELVRDMKNANHHYDDQHLNAYHLESDVFTHTMMVCLQAQNFSPENDFVRWSSLLHDVGKPAAREVVEERQRCRFIGHEGVSTFKAIDILNKADIQFTDKVLILHLIALHGDLFHFIKSDGEIKEDDVLKTFKGNREVLENLTHQVVADSVGRFWADGRVSSISYELPKLFKHLTDQLSYKVLPMKNTGAPQLTLLVGPPCSGKSTVRAKLLVDNPNTVVISRDDLVEKAGEKRGLNYSETFQFLRDNKDIEKAEVANELTRQTVEARKNGDSVIVDMTNMSKKSRRRWMGEFAKYDKKAVMFFTGWETLLKRNKIRAEKTGKFIPESVFLQMAKSFSMPMYGEGFNDIEYVLWNE